MADENICLALPTLYDAVVSRFDTDGLDVPNLFGWREPQKNKLTASRIVWVPGNPSGVVGRTGPARNPGRNPRPIATLLEQFHVVITASTKENKENERLQYQAARVLYDAWYRAAYKAAHGTFSVENVVWNTSKNERRKGAELIATCVIQAMIPDKAASTAPTGTQAVIDVSMLDVTEQITVTP